MKLVTFCKESVFFLTDWHVFTNKDFLGHLGSEDRFYFFQHHLILPNNQLKTYDTTFIVLDYDLYTLHYKMLF